MHERRRPDRGDITGETRGDPSAELRAGFTDWDNPEDDEDPEDAPEGYYEGEEDDSYVPGPGDPDYDLSEAAGYAGWEAPGRTGILPRWVVVLASLLLILAMLTPLLIRLS